MSDKLGIQTIEAYQTTDGEIHASLEDAIISQRNLNLEVAVTEFFKAISEEVLLADDTIIESANEIRRHAAMSSEAWRNFTQAIKDFETS